MVKFTSPTGDDSPSLKLPYPEAEDPIRSNSAMVEHAFRLIANHSHPYFEMPAIPADPTGPNPTTGSTPSGSLRVLFDEAKSLANRMNHFFDQPIGVLEFLSLDQVPDTDSTVSSDLMIDQTVSYAVHVQDSGKNGTRFRGFVGFTTPKNGAEYEDPDPGEEEQEDGEPRKRPILDGVSSISRWQIVNVKKKAQETTQGGNEPKDED